ncbi:MAG: alpha/beta hydrolase [Planctomycetia bacterium]|nr:alpha/beta hydrolase [Planctomycetia bacterium]
MSSVLHFPSLPYRLPALPVLAVVFALATAAASAAEPAAPQKSPLWAGGAPNGDGTVDTATGFLTVHLAPADKANGAALVICPGGGYGGLVTGAEGHGIAKWLNGHGIAGIVLEYRLPKGRSMVPLADAKHAIRTVRSKAGEWKLDPKRIGIIGFSAGGHLASTAAVHFDAGDAKSADPIEQGFSSRPDFAVLVYPVVSMGMLGHGGSRRNLLGASPSEESVAFFSNEKQVTKETPPIFLTHAKNDTVVVPENSRLLHEALKEHGIATEYLELAEGGHGLNGYKGPMWDAWQTKSLAWLASLKIIPESDAANP